MARPDRSPLRLALALCGALLLTGCVTTASPVTRFYVLDALGADTVALAGAEREPPLALDLSPLRLPQYLERPQIVSRSAGSRLELAEYDQWGGNLAKNMGRVLAQNLSRLLATPDVTMLSRRPATPADLRIEVDVMQFERGADGRVLLEAQWRLAGGSGQGNALVRTSRFVSDAVETGGGMDQTVAAMSALVAELGRAIATAVLARAER